MGNKLSIWELCMVFGVVAIILAGFMSAASASEGESDENNYENNYIKSLNKDDIDMSSVHKAKSIIQTRDAKSNLTDAQKKLSTALLQLIDGTFLPPGQDSGTLEMQMTLLRQFRPASSVSPATDGRVAGDMVYVYIHLKPFAETEAIEPYAWEVTNRDEENHLAVAWVKVSDLETLASQEAVRTIRPVMPPIVRTGSVTTEGDAIHRTYDVRTTYSESGAGVKVGIISNGVDHWTDARNSGDLPADLTVLSNTAIGDEGTAMLEIVHDMVPDADLYFHDYGANIVAFNSAIDDLVDAGCNVICDDVGWVDEPFFEDGTIASHVTSVLASNDIVYVSSAGNAGDKHYQGDYSDNGYDFHDRYWYIDFDPGSSAIIVLQWNDEFGASGNDYDLQLRDYHNMEDVLLYSEVVQDGDDDPLEFISCYYDGDSVGEAVIVVSNYNGAAATKTLELFIYPGNGAYVYANNIDPVDSIFGHPAVPGAIAAGAIDASDPGNDDIEFFSSQGPVTITYPSQVSRPKPDLCGVDGVAVTGAGGFPTPFFGTSAAAPHIAAIAAQLWGAHPSKTGDEIRTELCDSAVDLGSSGRDNIYGYGRTDALNAFENNTETDANWTFMVYLDGDNNLEPAAIIDMNEMESVGSTSNVNIVVQFDRIPGADSSNGDWTGTRRYYVTQDSDPNEITSTLVSDLGEVNMADPDVFSGFAEWAITNYPAENYALILWNHGSGWKRPGEPHDPLKCIIYDDTSNGDDLSMQELKEALGNIETATGETIDLIGFDACLMQMVEVAYQVADYSDVMVGSEESEPGDGWPYHMILANLVNDPTVSATDLGSKIVLDYISFYGTTGGETQSASYQAELSGLITAIDYFAESLNGCLPSDYDEILYARTQSESYISSDYIDLYDFADEVVSSSSNSTVQTAASDVMNKVSNTIIEEAHGNLHPDSYGFTIYFPVTLAGYNSAYENIDFAADTRWDEFLNVFHDCGSSNIVTDAEILLVDNDVGCGYEVYYKNALDANGYTYSYWNVANDGSPDLTTMSLHPGIIWSTGWGHETTLTSADQSNLASYLDAGGSLFVSGQDIGYDIANDTFYNEYLHSDYVADDANITTLAGIALDPIGDGLTLSMSGGDGAVYGRFPSEIVPGDADASMVFNYTGNGCGATKADTGTYRVVYFAFGFETINSGPDRNTVMGRVITWLLPHVPSVKGDLNGDGYLTPADAAIALQLAASGAHDDAADVSGDGYVTSLDALMILQAAREGIAI